MGDHYTLYQFCSGERLEELKLIQQLQSPSAAIISGGVVPSFRRDASCFSTRVGYVPAQGFPSSLLVQVRCFIILTINQPLGQCGRARCQNRMSTSLIINLKPALKPFYVPTATCATLSRAWTRSRCCSPGLYATTYATACPMPTPCPKARLWPPWPRPTAPSLSRDSTEASTPWWAAAATRSAADKSSGWRWRGR
jgi:hypothetical protein